MEHVCQCGICGYVILELLVDKYKGDMLETPCPKCSSISIAEFNGPVSISNIKHLHEFEYNLVQAAKELYKKRSKETTKE